MNTSVGDMPELELALMRRGIDDRADSSVRCGRCDRTPLVGEQVHEYAKKLLCDLCREREREPPLRSRLVHGPAFGHSIRIIDQRAA
jgi:hypothetical protein